MQDLSTTNIQTGNYRTRDLGEAALQITKGQQLISLQREGKIYWFVFLDKKVCEELANKYFFGEALVNAKQFHETLGRLKNRIFAES